MQHFKNAFSARPSLQVSDEGQVRLRRLNIRDAKQKL